MAEKGCRLNRFRLGLGGYWNWDAQLGRKVDSCPIGCPIRT